MPKGTWTTQDKSVCEQYGRNVLGDIEAKGQGNHLSVGLIWKKTGDQWHVGIMPELTSQVAVRIK